MEEFTSGELLEMVQNIPGLKKLVCESDCDDLRSTKAHLLGSDDNATLLDQTCAITLRNILRDKTHRGYSPIMNLINQYNLVKGE